MLVIKIDVLRGDRSLNKGWWQLSKGAKGKAILEVYATNNSKKYHKVYFVTVDSTHRAGAQTYQRLLNKVINKTVYKVANDKTLWRLYS